MSTAVAAKLLALPASEALVLLHARAPSSLLPGARDAAVASAALLLRHGDWSGAHDSVEKLSSPEAAWLHMLVHRAEPDVSNARYWARQLGRRHALFTRLHEAAARILHDAAAGSGGAELPVLGASWDADAMCQWYERARLQPGDAFATAVTRLGDEEWRLLFEYCCEGTRQDAA